MSLVLLAPDVADCVGVASVMGGVDVVVVAMRADHVTLGLHPLKQRVAP